MLSGPAILRISVLLLVAGVLAALAQYLLPAAPPSAVAPPPAAPAPSSPAPAAEAPQAPAPQPTSPQPQSQPQPPRRVEAAPTLQMPQDALAFPDAPAPSGPAPRGEAEVAQAEDTAPPRAVALVDLNTASVADLNRLQGGGTIGRAITAKRPYASVDQLLTKRVLSRSVYERIKDQVTVR